MKRPFFSVVSNKASEAGEILIYGIIGPDFWNDGVEARDFVRTLQYLEQQYERINIRINSPGGSVWDGLAIFNAIRASSAEIHTYNDGVALSMGMIILLAGKTIHVAKGSIGMLHTAGGSFEGNAEDMREAAEVLDKHDIVLTQLIADRSGKTVDEVKATWMDYKDHFFTSQEMIDAGLADVIEAYEAADMPVDPQNMSTHQLVAFYQERMEEPSESFINNVIKRVTNISNHMKFPKVFNLKGVTPTQAQLDEAKAELTEAGITGVGLYPESVVTDAANVTNENTRLTGELATANQTITNHAQTIAGLNTAAAAQNTRITELEAQVAAFGDNAGSQHRGQDGGDTVVDQDEEDLRATIANMPHNRAADALTGGAKKA